jgi:hypothetical protein
MISSLFPCLPAASFFHSFRLSFAIDASYSSTQVSSFHLKLLLLPALVVALSRFRRLFLLSSLVFTHFFFFFFFFFYPFVRAHTHTLSHPLSAVHFRA